MPVAEPATEAWYPIQCRLFIALIPLTGMR